jgi:hypothetical protein
MLVMRKIQFRIDKRRIETGRKERKRDKLTTAGNASTLSLYFEAS